LYQPQTEDPPLRIALITQEEPFYLPPALDALCRLRRDDLVALVILPSFNESLPQTARRLYDFYGPRDFARLCGRFLGARILDRLNRLKPLTRPFSARDVAQRHGVQIRQPAHVNAPEFLDALRNEIRPDLIVSVAASQIFGSALLGIPRLGCVNLHSAPLPRYQGMMPNFWTLLHQEPQATVTVHYMAAELDAGDIILQREVAILPEDSLHDLMVRSKHIGIQAMDEAIGLLAAGTAPRRRMDPTQASYFSFPTRADARRLRAQGRRLL
jgi:methionyl-tRNA formyltransferase